MTLKCEHNSNAEMIRSPEMNKSYKTKYIPAEWEPQDGILLAWPDHDSDWGEALPEVEHTLIEIIRAILRFESVVIAAPFPQKLLAKLQQYSINTDNLIVVQAQNNDIWARDFGPIAIVKERKLQLHDFGFNGWGLKYPANLDNQITRNLTDANIWRVAVHPEGMILEGGSIESDGCGTLMTTASCLLSPNRNPHMDQTAIELWFRQNTGTENILWLKHGYLAGDDTDGHIDTLARLCPQDTIVYMKCDDPDDEHFEALCKMEHELSQFMTLKGAAYNLVPLPWPQAKYNAEHERLPATYANFLIINNAVLVPTYADPADSAAMDIISSVFPGREVIGIDCSSIILQHGSLHCLTMQLPKGSLL